jgi:hypothetical protein
MTCRTALCSLLLFALLLLAARTSAEDPVEKKADPLNADDPTATRAQLRLAESFQQRATQAATNASQATSEKARLQLVLEQLDCLTGAAAEFDKLARFLSQLPPDVVAGHLTPEARLRVPFTLASCRFDLGQYEKALKLYDALVEKHKGTVACLEAMGGAVRCHAALAQYEQVEQRVADIRSQLPLLPDQNMRAQWEQWLTLAAKPFPRK